MATQRTLPTGVSAPPGPGDSTAGAVPTPGESGSFAAKLGDALDHGSGVSGAHMLLLAADRGSIPADGTPLPWLRDELTTAQLQKLVLGLAGTACQMCAGSGTEPCDGCAAQPAGGASACAKCLGFGRQSCPICNGTGLLVYESIPQDLWPGVMRARLATVEQHRAALVNASVPVPTDAAGARHLAVRTLNLNKVLGLYENAMAAAKWLAGHSRADAADALLTLARASRLAGNAELALRACLRALAAHLLQGAATSPDGAEMEDRASLLSRVADSESLAGTPFSHAFLA